MSPKGRKYALLIMGVLVLVSLARSVAPEQTQGIETAAKWLGPVFWAVAFGLAAYSVWEIVKDNFGRDD